MPEMLSARLKLSAEPAASTFISFVVPSACNVSPTPILPEPVLPTVPIELSVLPTSATVPAVLGSVSVTSLVLAGPISVTLFVPLSLSSKNSIKPALVAPFFTLSPALNTSLPLLVLAPLVVIPLRITTMPVPLGSITIFSFDLALIISNPFISRLPPSCGDVSSTTLLILLLST